MTTIAVAALTTVITLIAVGALAGLFIWLVWRSVRRERDQAAGTTAGSTELADEPETIGFAAPSARRKGTGR